MLNIAVTLLAASIVTAHVVAVPEQAPLHPAKVEPVAGVAVKVTETPELNEALQVVPQLMPVRFDVMVPVPVPCLLTVKAYCCAEAGLTVTVTSSLADN